MNGSGTLAVTPERRRRFEAVWSSPGGLLDWLGLVNNQPLGKRFMVTAFVFFLLGGVMALLIRLQLASSHLEVLGPQLYNQLFTMHGSAMMYLFVVPFLEGLALYLLPLIVGSRDVAFPRLTAFGYWIYLFGGLVFFASFVVGHVPDAGWFAYTPLSGPRFSGTGMDFWALSLALVEIAGLTAGVEIVVTILKFRAPGMTLARMPLFVWAMLVTGLMILFAFTALLVATTLLELDRAVGTKFFDPEGGGSTLLWQHLFWFFGHPEVYITFIPATGIVSAVAAAFARRGVRGHTLVAVAIVVTGFVSFGLWVHHMFATGLPKMALSFFTAASLMIGVASGTQVFAWIATLWGRRPKLSTPLLFVLGFLFLFVMGGLTGVMVAVVPFDWQVHDTFFVVAHLHYVLIGGVVFPILAGVHYWFPKFTGRLLDERLGKWSFWTIFAGFNVAFFPMHVMGLLGMPRRVYTYPASLGLDGYNLWATIGSFVLGAGFVLFVVNVVRSARRGERATDNPWGADSLEWSVPSPAPIYSFLEPPVVRSRTPLWDPGEVSPEDAAWTRAVRALRAAPDRYRATLVTDVVRAEPQAIQPLPGPTLVPFLAAASLVVGALGILGKSPLVGAFAGIVGLGFVVRWLWPVDEVLEMHRDTELEAAAGLPIGTSGSRSVAWWGAVGFLAIAATALGALLFSYFYLRLYATQWPQDGLPLPEVMPALAMFAVLAASALPQSWGARAVDRLSRGRLLLGLGGALAAQVAFLAGQAALLSMVPFPAAANAYASIFWVLHVALAVLVALGAAWNVGTLGRCFRRLEDGRPTTRLMLEIATLLGNFAAAAGVVVWVTLYASPRWL